MKIKIISPKKRDISGLKKLKSYLGKKVISKSGNRVGKVQNIMFSGNKVEGIIVTNGFRKIFIDLEYVNPSKDSIMLLIDPYMSFKNKLVFDADGKKVGRVVKIIRKGNTNIIESIVVRKKIIFKSTTISKADIDVLKKNIILKKVHKK